jgi:hypothetical protein
VNQAFLDPEIVTLAGLAKLNPRSAVQIIWRLGLDPSRLLEEIFSTFISSSLQYFLSIDQLRNHHLSDESFVQLFKSLTRFVIPGRMPIVHCASAPSALSCRRRHEVSEYGTRNVAHHLRCRVRVCLHICALLAACLFDFCTTEQFRVFAIVHFLQFCTA